MPRRNTLNAALDNEQARRRHTEDEVEKVRRDLTAAYASERIAKEQAGLLASELGDLRRGRERDRAEIEALNVSLGAQNAEIGKLSEEIAAYEELLGSTDSGKMKARIALLESQLRQSEELRGGLQVQVRDLTHKVQIADPKIATLQSRLAESEAKVRAASEALSAANSKLRQAEGEKARAVAAASLKASEYRQEAEAAIKRTARVVNQYEDLRTRYEEAQDWIEGSKPLMEEARDIIQAGHDQGARQTAEIKRLESLVQTAQSDAERAERRASSAEARVRESATELAKLRRLHSERFTFLDLVNIVVGQAQHLPEGSEGYTHESLRGLHMSVGAGDMRGYVSENTILIERVNVATPAAQTPPVIELPPPTPAIPTKLCSWCDKEFPVTAECFPVTGNGKPGLASWCHSCSKVRNRLNDMLDCIEPDWGEVGELLAIAVNICPTLADREPFIGHFLDPQHRQGIEPKARFLLEIKKRQVPWPKTYGLAPGHPRLAEPVPA